MRALLGLFLALVCSIAVAHTDGIYNRAANSVGDTQGIDSAVSSGVAALVCSYTPATTGTQNVAYTGATPAASGGVLAYTFSETGSLPTGLTISSVTGVISGTPSVSGSFTNIQVKVTDSALTVANCGTAFTLVIAPSFQGPGDVVSGATAWGSCARVYNASLASTATSLCDLVDSAAPTVTICTLRGTSTGFVDLTAYCPGSVTPAAKCAAATGAICNVQKVYDQTGTGNHWTNVTSASQPRLTFSALNGLPGLTFAQASASTINTAAVTFNQPFSFSGVYKRTSTTNGENVLAGQGSSVGFGPGGSANVAGVQAPSELTVAATDNTFHAVEAVANGVSSAIVADGTAATGTTGGPSNITAVPLRLGRSTGGFTLDGTIMEAGIWPTLAMTTGGGSQTDLLNTNQHSAANGYNF